jgi:uncharacterized protein YjbI with pentapeptide repeats
MDRKQELSKNEINELRSRWESPEGELIRQAILDGLKTKSYEWVEMLSGLPTVKAEAPFPEVLDDLRGISFSGERLDNISLTFVDLSYSVFERCSLNRVRLQGSKLSHASFKITRLNHADMVQVVADHSKFESCKLAGASLLAANFSHSSFNRVDMRKSILIDCKFEHCQLANINLRDANIEGARFPAEFDARAHIKKQQENDGSPSP